jgi:hypothetical protein
MKKQAKGERAARTVQQEKAPEGREDTSKEAGAEGDIVTGGAIGTALGGFSAGASGAAIGGAIGLIGGAIGEDEKKSRR